MCIRDRAEQPENSILISANAKIKLKTFFILYSPYNLMVIRINRYHRLPTAIIALKAIQANRFPVLEPHFMFRRSFPAELTADAGKKAGLLW